MSPAAYYNADESSLAFKPTRGGHRAPLYTEEDMSIESIELWHRRARPQPAARDFDVQLGCHLEEIVEMLDTLTFDHGYPLPGSGTLARTALDSLASSLKKGHASAAVKDRKAFLDSLADQVVTAVGAGHCAGMKTSEALRRVNTSNWSKFDDDGQPIRDANGKIAKGTSYAPPDLTGLFEEPRP